ncbi:hypothetical protein NHX12_007442 [Muraenolepis orangiensis]|uniref:Uncharacterized protein n=1 Tax=Muraenolepis orangiensis TaxID=630683 RepID=A0A9Q0IB71_9TELE|nr:hypothetical protein NHX12_007442 [Muraenolepis orangiensis]
MIIKHQHSESQTRQRQACRKADNPQESGLEHSPRLRLSSGAVGDDEKPSALTPTAKEEKEMEEVLVNGRAHKGLFHGVSGMVVPPQL